MVASSLRRLAGLSPRVWGALVVLLAAAGIGGWLWLRDSSLVQVRQVQVTGVTGVEAGRIRAALTQAAQEMTTLHVDVDRLRKAVATYPQVKDLRADAHPLHRLRVQVIERPPVAALTVGDERTPIAADGTLLKGRISANGLPSVKAPALPAGGRLTGGEAARALAVVAAAPAAMRRHVDRMQLGPEGLEAVLRDGPVVVLGDGTRPRAKWIATARVLGDPESSGATYIDVRLPDRPSAGGFGGVTTTTPTTPTDPSTAQLQTSTGG